MLCGICKEQEASVHLTQITEEKMQQMDLCQDCAKTQGVNDPTGFSLTDLMLGGLRDGGARFHGGSGPRIQE